MRYPRKFVVGSLMVALLLLLATAATASAEQSTLCKVAENPCSSANHYSTGTEVVLKSKGAIKWVPMFEAQPIRNIVCESTEWKGKTLNTGSSSSRVEVGITTSLMSSCGCSFAVLKLPTMKINWTSGTFNGTITSSGPEYSFNCAGETCAYGGEVKEGVTLTGGNPAVLTFKEAPLPKTGGSIFCGSYAKMSVEFEVAAPKPLYVSSS